MRSVGLKILKNKLSEYVRLAAGGGTVLVTDHDRVVAEIVEAVRKGWITPLAFPPVEAPPRRPMMRFDELMRDVEGDRAER